MISVVIPLYNKEEYISQTLGSVLHQTFEDFEVLIVNDGSTDASIKVVEGFNDPRIKLLNISNSGVSVARNKGIKAAKYPWIAFLDADDWWAPGFLKELVIAMEQFPGHSLFAGGRTRVFQKQAERYYNSFLPLPETTAVVNYFEVIGSHLPPVNSSNVLVRAALFEKRGFFKAGMKKHEDHDLWLRLAVDQPIVFVNKALSFYRKTESNTASAGTFSAADFDSYLATMIWVKSQVGRVEQLHFKNYYNRYVVLTYLQNYGRYSRAERQSLMCSIMRLLEGRPRLLARVIDNLPLQRLYPTYKKLKG